MCVLNISLICLYVLWNFGFDMYDYFTNAVCTCVAENVDDRVMQDDPRRIRPAAEDVEPREWSVYDDNDPWEPDWIPPFSGHTGVLVDTTDFSPVDYFRLYFPENAFELMVEETNSYALQFLDSTVDLSVGSRFANMKPVTIEEMKSFVALQFAMGLCNKHSIKEYWSTWWLTNTPFTQVMSRNRYQQIASFHHFADNTVDRPGKGEPGYDALWKIRPLLNISEPLLIANYSLGCDCG